MARSVVLQLLVDLSKFGSGLQSASRMMGDAFGKMDQAAARGSQAMANTSKQTKGLHHAMNALGGSLVRNILFFAGYYNALLAMNAVLTGTFSHILDLDEGLKKVQSITQESDESIAALRESLLDLAQKGELAGKSAAQISQAMFDIVQSGFSSAQALKIAAIAAEAAATGFTEADVAGRAIVAVLNAFNLPAEQARHVADILFKTVDKGVITFGDLATNLGDFIGTAAVANVSLEELGAVMAVLTKRGVTGAEAATSLNRLMLQFIKPSEKARKAAAGLGIELSADALASKGLVGALIEIEQKTGGSADALGKVFDEVRGLRGATILLTDDGRELVSLMEEFGGASEGAGALAEAFAIRSEALRFRLQNLGSQLLALSTRALTPVVGLLSKLIGGLSDLIADKDGHVKWFKEVVFGASGLGAALKDLWKTIRGVSTGRDSKGFVDLLKNLGEKAWSAVPLIARLTAALVRFINFLLEHKITLYAIIAALTAMVIAAHPVLFLIMALVTAIGTLNDENSTLGEKLVAIGVILGASALLFVALADKVAILWGGFRSLINLGGHLGGFFDILAAKMQLAKSVAQVITEDIAKGWHAVRDAVGTAITKVDDFIKKMGEQIPKPKIPSFGPPTGAGGAAPGAEAAGKGLQGFTKGLTGAGAQGAGAFLAGMARGLSLTAIRQGLGTVIVAGAGLIAQMFATALTLLTNPITLAVIALLVAAFLIYKYRKEIWEALSTVFDVLKDFFTKKLPDWVKKNFTARNLGFIFGYGAAILLTALFPVPMLIIKFRKQIGDFLQRIGGFVADIPGKIVGFLTQRTGGHAVWEYFMLFLFPVPALLTKFRGNVMSFLSGIASFVAEIPGKIAAFVGDHWLNILTAIFPVPMAIIRWHEEIGRFIASLASMMAEVPKRIAAFIADHWKDILTAIFPVPMAIIRWHEQITSFLASIATAVAGIPGRIAAYIGDHWKEIIGALVDVPKWVAEFVTKIGEFVSQAIIEVPGKFADLGTAIGDAIAAAIAGAIDVVALVGNIAQQLWDELPGPLKDFFGGAFEGFKSFLGLQRGIQNFIGGMAVVGEKGPELVRLPRGSDVVGNHNLQQAARTVDRGGAAGPSIHAEANVNATWGDWSALKQQVLKAVEDRLDEAAARANLARPRFGTLGVGMART